MTLCEKLKLARQKAGLSQKELAEKLNMNLRTYGSYERGERDVSTAVLLNICKVLSISSDYLLGREDISTSNTNNSLATNELDLSYTEKNHIKKLRQLDAHGTKIVDFVLNEEYKRCTSIPTFENEPEPEEIEIRHSYYKVSAGTGFDLNSGDDWETLSVPDTPEARKADFALTIKGDSMEPVYFNGDIVLVKEQAAIDVGEIGIYMIEGKGYIKKYGGDRLISLNAVYDDIEFSDYDEERIRCVGKVIGRI